MLATAVSNDWNIQNRAEAPDKRPRKIRRAGRGNNFFDFPYRSAYLHIRRHTDQSVCKCHKYRRKDLGHGPVGQ